MLLLVAVLAAPCAAPPTTPAEVVALRHGLKEALPEGWTFVSGRVADFGGHHAKTCWLATLRPTKAGDFSLVVEVDHDPKRPRAGLDRSRHEYYLGVGAAGDKRSVADPCAVPQCNVGDDLVVPIPFLRGDKNPRFTFEPATKRWHRLGLQHRDQAIETKQQKPLFKIDNKAAKHLALVTATHTVFTQSRSQSIGPWHHLQTALLEATTPGKLTVQAPVEIVPADAKVTAWVGAWYRVRSRNKDDKGGVRGWDFAGPPVWTMRVGDRIRLTFQSAAKDRADAAPTLSIPADAFVAPAEPYRTHAAR